MAERRGGNNIYKSGKLSRRGGLSSRKKINKTPIIIAACVLATFIFAIILGNILGARAEHSQTTEPIPSDSSSAFAPEVDKVLPTIKLNAYAVDMSGASAENSLSEQTGEARGKGNALFFDLKYQNGDLLYSSDVADELGIDYRDNLTLARLNNHFTYYNDYAVCRLSSELSPELDARERIETKAREISVLIEAVEYGFEQIVIKFEGELTHDTLAMYQAYIVDLKLACPTTPIGVELEYSLVSDADGAGIVSQLLSVADFYMLDLGGADAEKLEELMKPLTYFSERYGGVIMLSDLGDETLGERLAVLESKGMSDYIIK